ncbi:Formylmethanofuran dehydrogenase subunit D [Methanosarcina siciliae C2J]|uniref:Formylmethanofuran dehydrogenase subunit D n=3 Tax=Methanosarcina siciliae TaxID=38027 RepID=A0A0E3PF16_9EURY|nr:molybdopterin dinucleotide binding domain-containing protein [Methanosarcina siciliae]AKB29287.1 Formylmethanofuran dehydrogenase subunit D [Methanosarcina siciliae T4/M]AKB33214.1 Formylmethanofuran dehydrogenase subunit D [Methanosarcina siciliae HI350]AKB37459.1 Formylmethanofuran dehydrogenase subunit D [Methanosarcina siciliae C2J]
MDFGSFLKAPEINVRVITYSDIFQDKAMVENRFGEEYRNLSAVIKMDPADLKQLNVKKGDTVVLKNSFGTIVVKAEESGYENPHRGIAYMPASPWSNMLVSDETGGTGIPKFKDISVTVTNAKGEKVTEIGL